MAYIEWQPGIEIASPAYLDSSVVVSAFVRGDVRYAKTARLLGELLANRSEIVLSVLTVSESLWSIAKLSYCEHFRQPSRAHWNATVYQRNRELIFSHYGQRMTALHDLIRDWSQAGIRIEVVPTEIAVFREIAWSTPEYMRTLGLESADAVHLATAEKQARSLITTDSGFQRAASSTLDIIYLSPVRV